MIVDMIRKKLAAVVLPLVLLCGCSNAPGGTGSTGNTGSTQNNSSSAVDADTRKEAQKAAETFLDACISGEREKILEASNIETVCKIFQQLNDATDEEYQEDVEYEVAPWMQLASYTLSDGENSLESIRQARKEESDLNEYYIWKLDAAGKYDEADKLRGPNRVLGFYDSIEDAYTFDLNAVSKSSENDSVQLVVIKTGGAWIASPVEMITASLNEQQRAELAQFREDAINNP